MFVLLVCLSIFSPSATTSAVEIQSAGKPAQLDIRPAGEASLRITLKPIGFDDEFPFSPALADREYAAPAISLRELDEPVEANVGPLRVRVSAEPLTIQVTNTQGEEIQKLVLDDTGELLFDLDEQPVLGMGEGGPAPGRNWREHTVEFDRRGRRHDMRPRWQANCYGSRNPVALLIGTRGWGLFVATPWVHVDLSDSDRGRFIPWTAPAKPAITEQTEESEREKLQGRYRTQVKGRPPVDQVQGGVFDLFVFDAHDPAAMMKDVATIAGQAVMPPKWSLGYMQSHRTLRDDKQLVEIVDTFREKQIPLDAVIYLGTGFCPRGWNTPQPSLEFNPELFDQDPKAVIEQLHQRHVKVSLHVVPWGRDKLPTLKGTIPPADGETNDSSHIANYWQQHEHLVEAGADAWWPDEGDWFDFHERMKRHQLYYQGPLSTQPDLRPWSLHRNGHLGIARWGGWVWSGDTDSAWKTLEAQVAVGINHSLSLSPYWGSDIGGFYPNEELTGELYARWFQFGAFCPSFRSHGRTWWTRLPWGWGLSEMGPKESGRNPLESELNNPEIEQVCKKYAELRYQLMPYTYTLAWQAREQGLPLMRALWLHYPDDESAQAVGDQYLWGRDLLVAPVFEKGAQSRNVFLPTGTWYDYWTGERHVGGRKITREVDLATMPLYVRAGAVLPIDPVRQFVSQPVDEPMSVRVYAGANGAFTLYEDDGQSQEYLAGNYTLTRLVWDDSHRELTIEPANEKFEGKPKVFRVRLMPSGEIREVSYAGRATTVRFD